MAESEKTEPLGKAERFLVARSGVGQCVVNQLDMELRGIMF